MESAFRFADELGPEKIVHLYQPDVGLRAILVIDNVSAGPAIGGVRVAPDVSLEEAFRLARAMTLKNAAAGLRHGGGKAVIFADPKAAPDAKERLVRAFAVAIRDLGDYIPGPDMGLDEGAMAWIQDEIGRSVGLPRELGGIPLDEIGATGLGLAAAAEVAEAYCDLELEGARIAVQGFGSVGRHAARFLCQRGATLVAASDSRGACSAEGGIDPDALIESKQNGRSVAEFPDAKSIPADALIDVDCEIWIPAARPDVFRRDNVERLKARLVLEGANIPATREAEEILHERGVLVIPDFIANAGGVICAAVEYQGGTESTACATIEEKVGANTREVLEASRSSGRSPRRVALDLAERRVRSASSYRRWATGSSA